MLIVLCIALVTGVWVLVIWFLVWLFDLVAVLLCMLLWLFDWWFDDFVLVFGCLVDTLFVWFVDCALVVIRVLAALVACL